MTEQWTPENVARELLSVLPFINRIVAQQLNEETTLIQIRVLGLLKESPLTLSALAKKRQVSLQSTSEIVQYLVDRGWVTRDQHPTDRRQWVLQISEAGLAHYDATKEMMAKHLSQFLDRLTSAELEAIGIALPALKHAFTLQPEV